VLGQDGAKGAGHGLGPEGRGLGVGDAHGVRIELLDLQVLVGGHGDCGRGRVARVGGREDHVVGREGLAVVPGDALLELPGDALRVGRNTAVLRAGDLGGQAGDEIAFGVPAGQRFVEDARGVLFLGAAGKVRVQVGGALPPQQLERAAATALGGLVGNGRRGLRQAFVHQHHRGHRRRQAQAHHLLDEAAAGQAAVADFFDLLTQFTFLHGASPGRQTGWALHRCGANIGGCYRLPQGEPSGSPPWVGRRYLVA
jgi:hypothetical protein